MMFTPSNMLSKFLNAQPRDIFDVVGALMGYINADPQFKTDDFEQAVQYVLNHGVTKEELFAPFDATVDFEENPAKWNEEYYSFARVYLKDNFCEKRINHVKAVARKLHPVAESVPKTVTAAPAKPVQTSVQSGGSQSNGKKSQGQQYRSEKKSQISTTKVIIAVIVIVLLALVIGLIMSGK